MIILNDNNYNNNTQNTNNRQNTFREKEKKQTIILIYSIHTMKGLPCVICSVNIRLIRPKEACVFNLLYQYNSSCLKDFTVSAWSIIVIS